MNISNHTKKLNLNFYNKRKYNKRWKQKTYNIYIKRRSLLLSVVHFISMLIFMLRITTTCCNLWSLRTNFGAINCPDTGSGKTARGSLPPYLPKRCHCHTTTPFFGQVVPPHVNFPPRDVLIARRRRLLRSIQDRTGHHPKADVVVDSLCSWWTSDEEGKGPPDVSLSSFLQTWSQNSSAEISHHHICLCHSHNNINILVELC